MKQLTGHKRRRNKAPHFRDDGFYLPSQRASAASAHELKKSESGVNKNGHLSKYVTKHNNGEHDAPSFSVVLSLPSYYFLNMYTRVFGNTFFKGRKKKELNK